VDLQAVAKLIKRLRLQAAREKVKATLEEKSVARWLSDVGSAELTLA